MAALFIALATLAASPQPTRMPAEAPAMASVRIVSAARVHLGPAEQRLIRAAVHIDGARRPAMLVEFQ